MTRIKNSSRVHRIASENLRAEIKFQFNSDLIKRMIFIAASSCKRSLLSSTYVVKVKHDCVNFSRELYALLGSKQFALFSFPSCLLLHR